MGTIIIFIFFALIIAAVAVIFALQNTSAVTVTFFFWNFHGSLALVLLGALADRAVGRSARLGARACDHRRA